MKHGKKIQEAKAKIDKQTLYSVDEAVGLMRNAKFAKFDESV